MIVQLFQKIIALRINLRHVTVLSKDKIFIYNLSDMTFIGRLDLDSHLNRVVLSPNVSGSRPFIFYSNSVEKGNLVCYNLESKVEFNKIMAHDTAILRIACDLEGLFIATCSAEGDIIRFWRVDSGQKLLTFDLQRSMELMSLSISSSGLILALSTSGITSLFTLSDEIVDQMQS